MKRVLVLFFVLLLLGAAAMGWLWQDMHRYMNASINLKSDIPSLIVSKGTSFNRLLSALEHGGVINKPLYFKAYARINKLGVKIKAGEYLVEKGLSPNELLQKLVSGKGVQHSFTVIEGTTFKQLRAQLAQRTELIKQTLSDKTDVEILAALGAKESHPEGLFLADTFQIERNSTDLALLERSYKAQQQALSKLWEARDTKLPYKTSYEALIMASIVEKETAVAAERPLIAGVFIKRLKIGMRLQTDPTVIYGIGDKYTGNITRKDLRKPTAYNTYTINGLPPTPIAMVGREAIQAALNPKVGKSLYFVAKGDGRHQFSPSLKAHNRAVRQYQLRRKQQYRSTPEK
ncbi:endolytic transglycosylase MltG [Neptunomonas japonica]|uniref:endolytic transglycosylase MltG n=1 Tax=Neptunomonas japonica TaxID=417574 RepID=UPI000425FB07|nr:endolytic transglycosylase MltG [Neptunomonas japonica]